MTQDLRLLLGVEDTVDVKRDDVKREQKDKRARTIIKTIGV